MADVEVLDGRYRLTHRLGAGAMGEVYRAERIWLGDEVAIKFVRSEAGEPTEAHDRFMFEGQLAARLRHPSIVTVFDFGIDRVRGPFLVMEYLNGPTLAQEIAASGPFEVARAIDILDDLASALDLAHASGLVHRDLKPANIVAHRLSNGEVLYKIIDFGIGALLKEASEETTIDRAPFIGSLAYAAPEQLLGEAIDGHADIYSLGALTFEMLTGRVPFAEQNLSALLTRIIGSAPPKPSTLRPGLDQHVDEAVLTALDKTPARRWPTAGAFVDALRGPSAQPHHAVARNISSLSERYEVGERLGTGRLGSDIYAGRHRAIGSPVVIRILRRTATAAWDIGRVRFLREARAMQVAHPSILQVRDFGEEPDLVYIVTDHIEGSSLAELLAREGRLRWTCARRFTLDLIEAGLAIHRRGGLICGLTPGIIRVQEGDEEERLVISSAGIEHVQDVVASSDLVYVAPEVLLDEKPDSRTDIYTVGVIAYEMVTGRSAFSASTVPQLVAQILRATFTDPLTLAPDLPEEAAQVLTTCLTHRPDQRFQNLADLRAAWLKTPVTS